MDGAMDDVFVFDAYGTLFDVHSAVARHRDRIGPGAERLSELWRVKQLEYSWVRSLAGAPFRDFADLTAAALDIALSRIHLADPALREELLAAYEALDAYPEVAEVLRRLRAAGKRLAILSNGSPAMLERATASAGLAGLFDAVLSVSAVERFKTAPEAYDLAVRTFGVVPAAISYQSSNCWDIAGARLAGFRTVWVNRAGAPDEYPDLPADRVVRSLSEL
jgi:2-haloacid dehalogenase